MTRTRRAKTQGALPRDLAGVISVLALLLAAATALRVIGLLGDRRTIRAATSTERESDPVPT